MSRIAILTPEPESPVYGSRWPEVFERMAAPLAAAGMTVEGPSWSSDDLRRFDLVLPLLAWGYHQAGPRWIEAVGEWQRQGVCLQNPPSVLRWNADKRYLGWLAERGAPVTPTLYVDRMDEQALARAAEQFGTERLIAKPQVSAAAWQTIRWSAGQSLEGGPTGAAIIQPYLPSIETEGELSLIYFAGKFSHAIRKVPQPGDFRVQPEYDGIITAHGPTVEERAAAEANLAAAGEPLLYARVDLVSDAAGRPVLMELELVEPDLYLGHENGAGTRFAAAVASAAARLTAAER